MTACGDVTKDEDEGLFAGSMGAKTAEMSWELQQAWDRQRKRSGSNHPSWPVWRAVGAGLRQEDWEGYDQYQASEWKHCENESGASGDVWELRSQRVMMTEDRWSLRR